MDDLWSRWAEHYRGLSIDPAAICRDGIADPDRFAAAHDRVLFVMREADNWPGGDIRALLRDGPKYQVWHTVGRWAAGILQGFPNFEEIDRRKVMRDSLQQIASINLKKRTGGSSANLSVINAYAWQDRTLLREQIERIHATTIVACGTWNELVWLLDLPVKGDTPRTVLKTPNGSARVLPWVHPGRCNNRKTYRDLAALAGKSSHENGSKTRAAPDSL